MSIARSVMRQRCITEREVTEGNLRSWKPHITKQACRLASAKPADLEVQTGWSIPIDRHMLLLPLEVDIKPGDRVARVLDRREATVALEGPLSVDTVIVHADHQAAIVVYAGGLANAKLLSVLVPSEIGINGDPGELRATWEGAAPAILHRINKQGTTREREQQEAGTAHTTLILIDAGIAPVSEIAGAVWQASKVTVEDLTTGTVTTSQWTVKAVNRNHKTGLGFTVLELDEETPS